MITWLRGALFTVLSALALAGSGAGAWGFAAGTLESDSSAGVAEQRIFQEPSSVRGLHGPEQVSAIRTDLRRAAVRFNGFGGGDSDFPTPRFSGPAYPRSSALPAVAWHAVPPLPGIVHASIMARMGAISSFGTSLPPPPHA